MTILRKRAAMQAADQFDCQKIAYYRDDKIARTIGGSRNHSFPEKIEAIIHNAKCFPEDSGSRRQFSKYLWSFVEWEFPNAILMENGTGPIMSSQNRSVQT